MQQPVLTKQNQNTVDKQPCAAKYKPLGAKNKLRAAYNKPCRAYN